MLLTSPLLCATAGALGALEHPSIEQSAAGVRGILFYALSPEGAGAAPRCRLEASESALYGIPGLHVSGVRVGGRVRTFAFVAEAARLQADLGRETRVAVRPAVYPSRRWAVSLGLIYESVAVDGMSAAWLLSATGRSVVRLSRRVSVGGEVARYRLRGEAHDGADVAVALLVEPLDGAVIRVVAAVGRWTGTQPSVSTTLGSAGPVRLTLGYETATEALKGAVAVQMGPLGCVVGVHVHPTLGQRLGVSVSWEPTGP